MAGGPTLVLDPSEKLPFVSPLVLTNLAEQHGEPAATVQYEAGKTPCVVLPNTAKVEGAQPVFTALVQLYKPIGLAGKDDAACKDVDTFVNQAVAVASYAFQEASSQADDLDQHLALRTYFVGHRITAADIAIWGAIRSSSVLLGIVKKKAHTHLERWYMHIDALGACSNAVHAMTEAKSNMFKTKKTAAGFDLFLKGAKEGEVVTRFPPEPSGYLHVGHAKAAILNQYFAQEYKGRLIVRFDDTNPSKEKQEYEDSILEDLALLGITSDTVTHTSDYFDLLHELAVRLIKENNAYADDTQQEEMRAQRMDGIASARRDASVDENLQRFDEMCRGTPGGKRFCLRAKMSVDSLNKAMRDPVIYRCNTDTPHARTGTKYKAYPTYDFACPVVDSLEGITHALRTNEYHDRNPQYAWFLERLGLRHVDIWDYGRMNFVYTLLSKRKLQWFVDNGIVTGWDDPRFPTVRGIRRRGMTIDTIRQFILSQGPSQAIINMEWDNIWSLNKRILDPVVPRFVALDEAHLVPATIAGAPSTFEKEMPRHKKNPELGNKVTVFSDKIFLEQSDAVAFEEGEEVTLMDWGNAVLRKKHLDAAGVVIGIDLEANFEGDFKATKKKVTWLAQSDDKHHLTPVLLRDYDYLVTKKKLEEDDKFTDFLTPETCFTTEALADANVAALEKGDAIQFERKGYFILDNVQGENGRREFIRIPDGRAASSASKAAPDENPAEKKAAAAAARAKKAAEKAEKAKKKEEAKLKKKGGAQSETERLIAEGAKNVNMYSTPKITQDAEIPAKTNMYQVAPIL
ncbi:glutamate--tRNA ligase [Malassezia vespertilionis]|uniref:glutamate--tRNA ligase n=1 Tax=Malassezia vespertilionis TaxID=2020962 RepID=A0A2N1JF38_9BASI|nr:glutamate--tRNA ligase [Malassezia vespertilionis]PKI85171.1 hypothetical protein MVES_000760 [Malassezia vespertilionis]WFD05482.1 glutamate--tRNA ligase [Malassezia vespertilionis]